MAKVGRKKVRIEKPSWLNIDKYQQCKNHSAKQWGDSLTIRRKILDSIYSIKYESPFDEHISACDAVIEIIRENPCGVIPESKENELYNKFPRGMCLFNSLFFNPHMSKKDYKDAKFRLNEASLESFNIGSLSILEAIGIKRDLENILEAEGLQDITDTKKWYKRIHLEDGKGFYSEIIPAVDTVLREPFDSKLVEHQTQFSNRWHSNQPLRLYLGISLTSTDEEIKAQFNNWLSAARNKFGFTNESYITDTSLNKLYRNQILAFLDLQIWSAVNDLDVKAPQMYDWLFPKHTSENKPRKMADIKKIADYAISDGYLTLLMDLDLA